MADVVSMRPASNPDEVLEAAKGLSAVLVIGRTEDGDLYAAADLGLSDEQALWLAQSFIHMMMTETLA